MNAFAVQLICYTMTADNGIFGNTKALLGGPDAPLDFAMQDPGTLGGYPITEVGTNHLVTAPAGLLEKMMAWSRNKKKQKKPKMAACSHSLPVPQLSGAVKEFIDAQFSPKAGKRKAGRPKNFKVSI